MKKILSMAFICVMVVGFVFAGGQKQDEETVEYPTKDLHGYIMWGAGGGTDTVIRALVPHAEEALGESIVLVNKTGGTGAIATQYVYSQPSDGYTLLFGAENPQLYGVLKLSELDYRDFYPVNVAAYGTGIIVVAADAPWNSLKELIDDVHNRPGEVKMGITGPGGLPFTIGALLQSITEFDVTKVPFDGDGPGITALLGGHVDVFPAGLGAAQEHIRAGRIKALALVADTPVEGEDYPLITEALPEMRKYLPWGPFYGVWCKRDVPDAAKAALVAAFKKAAENSEFKKIMENRGNITLNISGDEADEFLQRWQSVTTWLLDDVGETKVSPADLGIPRP